MTNPQDDCAVYNLTQMSGGFDHVLDLMRGAMIEAGDRGEIKIIEADDDAFAFIPLEETLRKFLITELLDEPTWDEFDLSVSAYFPIFASIMVHGVPQEVH